MKYGPIFVKNIRDKCIVNVNILGVHDRPTVITNCSNTDKQMDIKKW